MADSIWGTSGCLGDALYRAPYEFELTQAVRLLLLEEGAKADHKTIRLNDAVRFRAHLSMAFPPSSVMALKKDNSRPPTLTVSLAALLGPMRILPDDYTELAIRQSSLGDGSFAAFFDIFQDRLFALYYCVWQKHQFVVEQEQARHGRDAVTGYLLDLIGMGTAGLTMRLPFPETMLLRYAGLLAQRPRSAECLRAILHDFLQLPVAVEQFRGRWHGLETEELTWLGDEQSQPGLGEGTIAGDMVWNLQSLLRITIGPLNEEEFFDFLPDGDRFKSVSSLVRWYLGPAIDFELQPMIATEVMPRWGALGCISWGERREHSTRLGWSSWLSEEPFEETVSDALFTETEMPAAEGMRWQ